MRSDVELVDSVLKILNVGDRATLSSLTDDKSYDPIGCGCCAYSPTSVYDGQGSDGMARAPYDKAVYRTDKDYVMWLREGEG